MLCFHCCCRFTINATTGAIYFNNANNSQLDSDSRGAVYIVVVADDTRNHSAAALLVVEINEGPSFDPSQHYIGYIAENSLQFIVPVAAQVCLCIFRFYHYYWYYNIRAISLENQIKVTIRLSLIGKYKYTCVIFDLLLFQFWSLLFTACTGHRSQSSTEQYFQLLYRQQHLFQEFLNWLFNGHDICDVTTWLRGTAYQLPGTYQFIHHCRGLQYSNTQLQYHNPDHCSGKFRNVSLNWSYVDVYCKLKHAGRRLQRIVCQTMTFTYELHKLSACHYKYTALYALLLSFVRREMLHCG